MDVQEQLMTGPFKIQMKEATRLTRLGKLDEAVRVIMAGASQWLRRKSAVWPNVALPQHKTLRRKLPMQ